MAEKNKDHVTQDTAVQPITVQMPVSPLARPKVVEIALDSIQAGFKRLYAVLGALLVTRD